jgi:hypothetical protein
MLKVNYRFAVQRGLQLTASDLSCSLSSPMKRLRHVAFGCSFKQKHSALLIKSDKSLQQQQTITYEYCE